MKYIFYVILFMVISAVMFYLFKPIYFYGIKNTLNINVNSWGFARNYYVVLSSISTVIIGWIGVVIGYFYFENRKKHDNMIIFNGKVENRIKDILDKINENGKIIDDILGHRISCANELDVLRYKIINNFDDIVLLIENNEKLLGTNDSDLVSIIKYYSHIDQSSEIMRISFDSLRKIALCDQRSTAQNYLRDAKEACISCLPRSK